MSYSLLWKFACCIAELACIQVGRVLCDEKVCISSGGIMNEIFLSSGNICIFFLLRKIMNRRVKVS